MAQNRELIKKIKKAPAQPLRPEERIDASASDMADPNVQREIPIGEPDPVAGEMQFGEMNEADARDAGYIGEDGLATH